MVTLCGNAKMNKRPLQPYSDIVCSFLDEFSKKLRSDEEARKYADIMTFAFWARKGSILKKKTAFFSDDRNRSRIGKGIVFHIAPSNVPVNCMYSYAFGLLAGNGNIVRVSSKEFDQVNIMCRVLNSVLEEEAFSVIREMTSFVRYDREETERTKEFSKLCDVRVIWGGDETIRSIRNAELPARSTDITFADRYSFGIIDIDTLSAMTEDDLVKLAEGFYNDTYLMDQNACSTPHLICFKRGNVTDTESVKKRFWEAVKKAAEKYDLSDIKASDKYTNLCDFVMTNEADNKVDIYCNYLYVCKMNKLPDDVIFNCRGSYGMFFEYEFDNFDELNFISDPIVQTCAVSGINDEELLRYIIDNSITGIDRIVPFGKTLDIDTIWDGYDLIGVMSRIIG